MNTESKSREALHTKFRELGYTTNSQTSELLDLVFETLSQPSPPEQVERAACGCTEFEQSHCRAGIVAEAHHPDCVKVERAGLVDECKRLADMLEAEFAAGRISNTHGRKAASKLRQLCDALAAQPATAQVVVGQSLLREPVKSLADISKTIPGGCYCPPGTCQAPVIMGRQTPCLRLTDSTQQPAKAPAQATYHMSSAEQLAMNRAARKSARFVESVEQQQAGAVVSDAPKYRLLQRNVDVIEATDEFLAEDAETWAIDPNGIFVGNTYGGMVLRPARRAVLAQEEGQVPKHSDKQDDHDPAVTAERFLIQHPRRSGTVEVVTAADHEGAVFAARLRERERLRGYFLDALADKGIVWPGEVDILYDKCFAAPTPDHSPGNMAQPIHDPAVTTPREVLVGESPVDRIAAPAQEQPKSDAQIILDIITLFERRPEFKAAFREEWLRYTGVEQQQAGAVVSDEQISDLWLMSVDCVGLPRDKAISFARAVLALSQGGK